MCSSNTLKASCNVYACKALHEGLEDGRGRGEDRWRWYWDRHGHGKDGGGCGRGDHSPATEGDDVDKLPAAAGVVILTSSQANSLIIFYMTFIEPQGASRGELQQSE
jgi:hypothetical protein